MDTRKKTIAYERYIFHSLLQNRNESTSDFVDRLKRQADYCNFENVESQIFDKIIEKTKISQLRKSAFENEMNLSELLSFAARLERKDEIKMNLCRRCGFDDHKSEDKNCPARGKICKNCNRIGHLARACLKSLKRNSENVETFKRAKIEECFKHELNHDNVNEKEKLAENIKPKPENDNKIDPRKRRLEPNLK